MKKTKRKGVFFRSLMPNEKKSSIFFTSSANAKTPPMNTVKGYKRLMKWKAIPTATHPRLNKCKTYAARVFT